MQVAEILRKYKKLFAIAVCAMFVWTSGTVVVAGLQAARANPTWHAGDVAAVTWFLEQLEYPDLPHDQVTNRSNADKLRINAEDPETWGSYFYFDRSRLTAVWDVTSGFDTDLSAGLHGIIKFTGCDELGRIDLGGNEFTAVDVTDNPWLYELNVFENRLTSLDVSNNPRLRTLRAFDNRLSTLDLSNNTLLESLNVANNQITTLDLSHNVKLYTIYMPHNSLTSLDVSKNLGLRGLYVSNNNLTTLDLSHNATLWGLAISHNEQLTSLDLSYNTQLQSLNISHSNLTSLDLSQNDRMW